MTRALTLTLLLTGCAGRQLSPHADDLVQQAEMMAESCEGDGYGEGLCKPANWEAHVGSLRCMAARLKGERCEGPDAKP